MPVIVGPAKINAVSDGIINFGDSFYLSPLSENKAISGSGDGNVGDFLNINNGISIVKGIDPDLLDQNQTANA
ncbi:spore germination protein [Bacillus alveayuensis]|jgi:spore germination protein PF|uniref:Spore germination protein PF n=1 Tax=Aeribacillus alveayuensis TaxID=279215 RepID=A0ABT9VNG8_9BACI|nr:spore germination protein [Bacillus alveayuensis]MDQ0162377.1 spore germination protein PF [Bacillus alveayuensis]